MNTTDRIVTATPIADEQRQRLLPHYFGTKLTDAEMEVYQWMGWLCPGYAGGPWRFFALSNGGFYMAPYREERYEVRLVVRGYRGELSADAAGILACLLAFDGIAASETEDRRFAALQACLHDFAEGHVEASEIFRALECAEATS